MKQRHRRQRGARESHGLTRSISSGEVLEITRSIHEKNAGLPFDRVRLAKAMGTTPASSAFMMKLNSSAKYGLTEGGYSDARISLTGLGEKAAKADPAAIIEAAMRPQTFRGVL